MKEKIKIKAKSFTYDSEASDFINAFDTGAVNLLDINEVMSRTSSNYHTVATLIKEDRLDLVMFLATACLSKPALRGLGAMRDELEKEKQ